MHIAFILLIYFLSKIWLKNLNLIFGNISAIKIYNKQQKSKIIYVQKKLYINNFLEKPKDDGY